MPATCDPPIQTAARSRFTRAAATPSTISAIRSFMHGRVAKRRLRSKIPALTEALTGRFNEHHAFLAQVHLDLIDQHTAAIQEITARIEVVIEPFQGFRDLITTIPGIATLTADVIIAETGADMTRFPTADHLACGPARPRAATSPPGE